MRRQLVSLALACGVVSAGLAAAGTTTALADTLSATSATINSASFTASAPPASAPKGVSPEAFYDEATKTYYLLTTAMPPTQYSSADGVTWTPTATALPRGLDWSIVQEGPSSYRLYYAEMVPTAPGSGPTPPCTPKTKALHYATSTDLQTWTAQPGVLLDDVGCGVPHVMKTKAGKYFLYFNAVNGVHGVNIATSNDGLSWNLQPGVINDDTELVDPAPLELPDGTFVMVASTTGGQGQYQYLQLLSSSDAVHWVKRSTPLYKPSGAGAFDPSIELVDGKLRVWFGYSPGGSYDAARITNGTLVLGAGGSSAPAAAKAKAGSACAKKGAKSGALVCKPVKGKLTWVRR